MLNHTLQSPFQSVPHYHKPCSAVRNNAHDIPIMPVLACGFARFRVRYCAFQALKRAISHAEMVLIAGQKNDA